MQKPPTLAERWHRLRHAWHAYWLRREMAAFEREPGGPAWWQNAVKALSRSAERADDLVHRGWAAFVEAGLWRWLAALMKAPWRLLDGCMALVERVFEAIHLPRVARFWRGAGNLSKAADLWLFNLNKEFRARVQASGWYRAGALVAVVLVVAAGVWAAGKVPGARARWALSVARREVAEGTPAVARVATERAVRLNPYRAEAWRLVGALAERAGEPGAEILWGRAAELAPDDREAQLVCARLALAAGNLELATTALKRFPAEEARRSAQHALLSGELARREGRIEQADADLARSVALDPTRREAVLALGTLRASSPDRERRATGTTLLDPLKDDARLGIDALRALLGAAAADREVARVLEVDEALATHRERTIPDLVSGLQARLDGAPATMEAALGEAKRRAADDPAGISAVMGWMNARGFPAETLRWAGQLDAARVAAPPVAIAVADAYRLRSDFAGLQAVLVSTDWGSLEFLAAGYRALAVARTGTPEAFAAAWKRALALARVNPGHQHFLAGVVYTWGLPDPAVELWWTLRRDPRVGLPALGALARHYQLTRDAEGQLKAFHALYELVGQDSRIANNFAYLAAVVGSYQAVSWQLAQTNFQREPDNVSYASTWAFVLWRRGEWVEALPTVEALLPQVARHPEIASTCGLLLATAGRREEARALLAGVELGGLTRAEAALIEEALKNLAREPAK